uniref:Uncharacterized protein n=1 Tax=Arundo donax TaxID=35708 RepID=A0A0A9E689_ARUDO
MDMLSKFHGLALIADGNESCVGCACQKEIYKCMCQLFFPD